MLLPSFALMQFLASYYDLQLCLPIYSSLRVIHSLPEHLFNFLFSLLLLLTTNNFFVSFLSFYVWFKTFSCNFRFYFRYVTSTYDLEALIAFQTIFSHFSIFYRFYLLLIVSLFYLLHFSFALQHFGAIFSSSCDLSFLITICSICLFTLPFVYLIMIIFLLSFIVYRFYLRFIIIFCAIFRFY